MRQLDLTDMLEVSDVRSTLEALVITPALAAVIVHLFAWCMVRVMIKRLRR